MASGSVRPPVVGELLGVSDTARELNREIREAARSEAKVLVTGESGVGKEIVGQMIHALSQRTAGPAVTINCAGMPDSLLESELFGHARGSFTDAYRDQQGWLEQANGGTIFLDEVGEMSLRMQALLLRFLETGEIQRIGSDRRASRVDVRVVTATNRNLHDRIGTGEFREDLYYRLNVIHIDVPPLRARREDIPAFVEHFLRHYCAFYKKPVMGISLNALAALQAHHWPGNIRELRNLMERLVVRARKEIVMPDDLPPDILGGNASAGIPDNTRSRDGIGQILNGMDRQGLDFWEAVHGPFMLHDMTRNELRALISVGLTQTKGSYRLLVRRFNMPQSDYRRFLSFLRKHECHMPFQRFRTVSSECGDREHASGPFPVPHRGTAAVQPSGA